MFHKKIVSAGILQYNLARTRLYMKHTKENRWMKQEFSRTALLLGQAGMERLAGVHVAVFGVGGVGCAAIEGLARAGVGALTLIDNDTVSVSNRNRQLIALSSTTGQSKVQAMAARVLDINPDCRVTPLSIFVTPEHVPDLSVFDYVIDAIDTVTAKLYLIETCTALGVPIISSMGTGNKLDPTQFQVADIYQTSVCPLARIIRQQCKKRHIPRLKVVYSTEQAACIPPERYALCPGESKGTAGRPIPASLSFVPPVAGFILAGEVIKDLTEGLR